MDEKKAVLEAALYVAEEPIDSDEIADLMNLGSKGFVQTLIDKFSDDLKEEDRGLELIENSEGYELQVKKDFVDDVKEFAPHQDISEAKLRTLSLIAYNAPVKQSKVIDIRGNRAYRQIKDLEERGLIESSKEGRTKILDVTEEFMDYFELESMEEFRNGVDLDEDKFFSQFDDEDF